MNKIIVLVLFFVIVFILVYFDLFRYFKIHYDGDDEYIYGYKKIPRFETNNRIIVSFTTTQANVKKIKPMIKSLLDQTVRIDQIMLNVAENCNIPKEYDHMVNIYKCGVDYGEGMKCIPTILREGEYGTIIIMLNDDYVYGNDFIEKILTSSKQYPNKSISSNGALLVKPEFFNKDILDVNGKIDTDGLRKLLKVSDHYVDYYDNFKKLT